LEIHIKLVFNYDDKCARILYLKFVLTGILRVIISIHVYIAADVEWQIKKKTHILDFTNELKVFEFLLQTRRSVIRQVSYIYIEYSIYLYMCNSFIQIRWIIYYLRFVYTIYIHTVAGLR